MKRNIIITLLSLLLAGVTGYSLLYAPASAKNRFRPIPAHAQLVYNNQNPDGFLSIFPSLGKMDGDVSNLWKYFFQGSEENSKPQRSWLEKCPLAVATVSFAGRGRRDTWVAVSELGGPAALALRWKLAGCTPEGVTPARSYAAWPVWKVEHPSLPSWARVRFTITEGLLICSVSSDSHDIYRLLDCADGRAASLAP